MGGRDGKRGRGPWHPKDACEPWGPDSDDPDAIARWLQGEREGACPPEGQWTQADKDEGEEAKAPRRGPFSREAWEAHNRRARHHWKRQQRAHWRHHYWGMSRLGHFVRARLHRRLFLWFGLSIFMTGVVVATVFSLVGGNTWKQEMIRLKDFASHRFEEVWSEPARRDALAQSFAKDLDIEVEVTDASGKLLVLAGGLCKHAEFTLPVMRAGTTLGQVRVCNGLSRAKTPEKVMLPLLAACLVLWMASGKMARRLAKPVDALVQATEALGAGRLNARAEVLPHATGEFTVLAVAFNHMAGRIEKQVADQRELLAAVSHELRTPLARLRVLTELLRDGGGNPKTLDQVDREVVELDALVGELLASSRLDFGQLTPRVLDGRTLATQALERAGLAVELLDVNAPEAGLVGDATLLGRALANLLDNARRHGGGVEMLRVQEQGEHLAFCVEDRGPGLQPGEETRIFQPFYRKDRGGEAREAGSLGLGLALVQRIARAHGGETFAENRDGGGARVGFTVKKAGPPGALERPAAA